MAELGRHAQTMMAIAPPVAAFADRLDANQESNTSRVWMMTIVTLSNLWFAPVSGCATTVARAIRVEVPLIAKAASAKVTSVEREVGRDAIRWKS